MTNENKRAETIKAIGGLAGLVAGVFCGIEAGDIVLSSIRDIAKEPITDDVFKMLDAVIAYTTYVTSVGLGAIGGAYLGNTVAKEIMNPERRGK
jgi:hypothetical protein